MVLTSNFFYLIYCRGDYIIVSLSTSFVRAVWNLQKRLCECFMFIYTVSDIYIAVCGIILIYEQSKLLNTNVQLWYVFWKISEDLVIAYVLELWS